MSAQKKDILKSNEWLKVLSWMNVLDGRDLTPELIRQTVSLSNESQSLVTEIIKRLRIIAV